MKIELLHSLQVIPCCRFSRIVSSCSVTTLSSIYGDFFSGNKYSLNPLTIFFLKIRLLLHNRCLRGLCFSKMVKNCPIFCIFVFFLMLPRCFQFLPFSEKVFPLSSSCSGIFSQSFIKFTEKILIFIEGILIYTLSWNRIICGGNNWCRLTLLSLLCEFPLKMNE